jgi:hypothetical protein
MQCLGCKYKYTKDVPRTFVVWAPCCDNPSDIMFGVCENCSLRDDSELVEMSEQLFLRKWGCKFQKVRKVS